jgi:hypothetical protein
MARVVVDCNDELRADLDTLLLLVIIQKFGDPFCELLHKTKILMKHGVNG